MKFPIKESFKLTDNFVEKYKNKTPPFGFNGLGEFVFMRTYSRIKPDGKNESWWETTRRVVEGIYSIQKQHIEDYNLGWNQMKAQKSAQEMYDRIFNIKFLPAGRSLWAMGTDLVMKKGLTAALYNCAFLSTENIQEDPSKSFCVAMDMLMCGVGVGFDVIGAGKIIVKNKTNKSATYIISDDREGWIKSLEYKIMSFFGGINYEFDYSLIRPKGSLIKTFGGVSAGFEPLMQLHKEIDDILSNNINKLISITTIVNIFNVIGKAVVAGNVRRSAEAAIGNYSDEFLNLKNYDLNPKRESYGWVSNNSIICEIGDDYSSIAKRIKDNAEPGIIWLENIRKFGRIRDTENNNLDHKISGLNPCVVGNTEILTKNGYKKIKDLIDTPVEIWNGFEWSIVIPKITGKNLPTLSITFSDGRSITCTKYHKFYIADGYAGKYNIIEAKDLQIGMKLIKHEFPILESDKELTHAYTNGFVAADGMEKNRLLYVYYPKKMCLDKISGKKIVKEEINNNRFKVILDFIPESKEFVPLDYSIKSKLEWLSGLFDGDGTELKEGGLQLVSTNSEFLKKLQKLLSELGINSKITHAQIAGFRALPNHKGSNELYKCRETQRICIGAIQIQKLLKLGLKCQRLIFNKRPQRDASQFTKITKITETEFANEVYCFNEPKNHTAIFNGVITGQCFEIGLESSELCNLVETFPTNAESLDDFVKTIKYAYLYAKSITLLGTHWPDTNRVLLRNRRIGLSMTGITMFIDSFGIKELEKWAEEGYKSIKYYDKIYSDWFAIPLSIKTTTIKPSGTLSLLAGVTPGMHYAESNYYIRRVRISSNSPFIEIMKNAGYNIESVLGQEESTVVIDFPISIGEKSKTLKDVSMWEQLSLASFLQEHWSDNSVSVTISFDPKNEGNFIVNALNYFQYKLKSVSFLPRKENGAYKQMPYEEISKEKYESLIKNLKPLDFSMFFSEESIGEKYCSNDGCTF